MTGKALPVLGFHRNTFACSRWSFLGRRWSRGKVEGGALKMSSASSVGVQDAVGFRSWAGEDALAFSCHLSFCSRPWTTSVPATTAGESVVNGSSRSPVLKHDWVYHSFLSHAAWLLYEGGNPQLSAIAWVPNSCKAPLSFVDAEFSVCVRLSSALRTTQRTSPPVTLSPGLSFAKRPRYLLLTKFNPLIPLTEIAIELTTFSRSFWEKNASTACLLVLKRDGEPQTVS